MLVCSDEITEVVAFWAKVAYNADVSRLIVAPDVKGKPSLWEAGRTHMFALTVRFKQFLLKTPTCNL